MGTTKFKTFKQVFGSKFAAIGLGVSVVISGSIFCVWNQIEKSNIERLFDNSSKDAVTRINRQIDKYMTIVHGAGAFVGNTKQLTHAEFESYVRSLQLEKNYADILALNYVSYVPGQRYQDFITHLKDDYKQHLHTSPELLQSVLKSVDKNNAFTQMQAGSSGSLEHNYIVTYSQPLPLFHDYIGRNIGINPDIVNALNESVEKNDIVSSGKLHNLIDKTGKNHITLWFRAPVYTNNDKKMSVEERKRSYMGSVGVGIDLDSFLQSNIKNNAVLAQAGFQVFKRDKDGITKELMVDSRFQRKDTNHDWPSYIYELDFQKGPYVHHGSFNINDRVFDMFIYGEVPSHLYSKKAIMAIICGLAGITIFTIWMLMLVLINSRKDAHSMAEIMTQDLRDMAWYDNLTGLYNRARSLEYLNEKIADASDHKFLLMFIDLDGFKKINDTLGHEAGDVVLNHYAQRIIKLFEGNADITLGRVGGDEFILICDIPANTERSIFVDSLAEQVASATHHSFEVKAHKFIISQSIGIVFYPDTAQNAEELLRKADMAMYSNKKDKSLSYSVYSRDIEESLIEKTKLESELLNATKNNELHLVFQPKMHQRDNGAYQIGGAEALLRWKNAKFGDVPPSKFIKIAEENGSIYDLTLWLIDHVCEKIKKWEKEHSFSLPISINLSAQQLLSERLCVQILEHVEKQGVSPSKIVFEITEGTVMKNPEFSTLMLKKFTDKGFRFSIDDFGTGYSSLSYLTKLPVHELKIDRSFVFEAQRSKNANSVIIAIIAMAHKLELKVVAEGVETKEQLDFLQQHRCDEYQGYFFSRPLREADFLAFIKKNEEEVSQCNAVNNDDSALSI